MSDGPPRPRRCGSGFDEHGYLADDGMATAVFLTLRLGLPLLLEGEPGVGKTAAAQVLAQVLDAPLVRLQCYEGLTASEALYDWNHQRQLLAIRVAESQHERLGEADLFSEEFLVERPILRCIRHDGPRPPVLLIDEIDRADDEFEALLLEALGEGSVTVPELGTFRPSSRRSWCSPPTAAATCTTPCGDAASTTGSTTRSPSAWWPSCGAPPRRRACRSSSPRRSSSATSARSTSTSRRGWPRRSTGSPRCPRSAPPSWSTTWW